MTQGFKEQSGRSLKRQTYTWGHRMRNREGGERGGTRPRFCSSFCLQKFPPGRLGPFLILQGWGPTTSPGMLPSKPVHPSPLTWRYSFDVYRLLTFWFTYVLSVISAFTYELHEKPVASAHRWIPTPRKGQWVFVDWLKGEWNTSKATAHSQTVAILKPTGHYKMTQKSFRLIYGCQGHSVWPRG